MCASALTLALRCPQQRGDQRVPQLCGPVGGGGDTQLNARDFFGVRYPGLISTTMLPGAQEDGRGAGLS
eukprot:2800100-Rhodomonas_salina.1